jgi:hypothetical protein
MKARSGLKHFPSVELINSLRLHRLSKKANFLLLVHFSNVIVAEPVHFITWHFCNLAVARIKLSDFEWWCSDKHGATKEEHHAVRRSGHAQEEHHANGKGVSRTKPTKKITVHVPSPELNFQ